MRGKVIVTLGIIIIYRITPAYAGKSYHYAWGKAHHGDHPRLCGEKHLTKSCGTVGEGSPPPMRGKDDERANADLFPGITPAYAGKSDAP